MKRLSFVTGKLSASTCRSALILSVFAFLALYVAGCATQNKGYPSYPAVTNSVPPPSQAITLQAGDVVQITFPGAPNLNATQQIRRDGKISLNLVGEVSAAGLTPSELEKKLVDLYSSQLVDKQVNVTVASSTFPVFVTGAVMHPGKVQSDRPITALEAIMEAGGFDYTRANLKSVTVIRNTDGRMQHYKLNLKTKLQGTAESQPFYLRPSDIVYVPERFTWF